MEQRASLRGRLFGLAVLTVLGTALIASTLLGALVGGGSVGASGLLASLAVNVAVLLAVYGLLTHRRSARGRRCSPGRWWRRSGCSRCRRSAAGTSTARSRAPATPTGRSPR